VRLKYIVVQSVMEKVHGSGNSITKDALKALDMKVEDILNRAIRQWNGHHKRITSDIIYFVKG
jgi:hypothetical protein